SDVCSSDLRGSACRSRSDVHHPRDPARRRDPGRHLRKEPVMRIAYALLDPGIGVFGTKGASVHVQEVVRALRADGHEVTVFCTRTNDDVPADLADLDVRRHRLPRGTGAEREQDRKSTRLNSSHVSTSYAVCCSQIKTR